MGTDVMVPARRERGERFLRLPARLRRPLRVRQRATVLRVRYDVLVVSNGGGERFTIEPKTPLSAGDSFEHDSASYRVLAVQPGPGPFDGVIEAERLSR